MFRIKFSNLAFNSLLTLTLLSAFTESRALADGAAAAKGSKDGRKKVLTQEGRAKGNTKTKIDFDDASIDGERRIPAGVAIGGAKQDNEYDLINLRLRWHPEMIKSTGNLETGKGN